MARTYYTKRAQQRYATKPVLDPETGQQKLSPKMRNGKQMTSKSGRPVFMKVTERDLSRPLPMPKCSKCGQTIEVGTSYSATETKMRTIIRCGRPCPPPHYWEYSSSLAARLAQIDYENDPSSATDKDSLEEIRDNYASAVRDLAQEKQESAQNIVDGFGHETSQSEELQQIGDDLETWADEIESVDFPEDPEPGEEDCDECQGTGTVDCPTCLENDDCEDCGGTHEANCDECGGSGQVTLEEPTDDQWADWLEEARQALSDKLGECPV